MLKLIIYYLLIFSLSVFLITPFILQWLLKKLLKKQHFNIKFAGLFTFNDIRMQVAQAGTVFQSLKLSIGSISLKKIPKRWALVICIRKPVIQVGVKPLDLYITGNISNLQRMATNDSDHDHIVKNSLSILNFLHEIYTHQTKVLASKKNTVVASNPKKKSLNDNPVFFKQLFGKILMMAFMKLVVIEVTDCEFEIVQPDDKNQMKSMFKLEVGRYDGNFEYKKTDSFLMNNRLKDSFMYLRDGKEKKLDLITGIEDFTIKLDLPLGLRFKNSILKSRMETNLNTLEVHLKEEHLQAIIQLYGNIDLAKSIISLCLKQSKKMNQPEQFESEVNLMKKNLRIKKSYVPVMPRNIRVVINSLKITLPLQTPVNSQNILYDDEIVTLNLNNFVFTTHYSKQDDANYPSKFTISVVLAAEKLLLRINSMIRELVSIEKMNFEVEAYIQKVKGEALHYKGFRHRVSFNQTSFEMHYCFFLLIKKILLIEKIQLTYKLKNYKPLIKYIFKSKVEFLQKSDQNFGDPSFFTPNFMEMIYQNTSKEEELVTDMKLLSQELILNVKDLHLVISDLQKSFVVELAAKDLVYKNFRQEEGTNYDDIECGKIIIENKQEFDFPFLESQELALHLVGDYLDEREARSSIDLFDISVRLNDFIMLKFISIFDEYATFYKKVGFNDKPKQKAGWNTLKKMFSTKITELMALRAYKAKVKEAMMHVQVRKVLIQYDYLETYAMRIQVDEIQKHSEKISNILNYPTISNFSVDFFKLEQDKDQTVTRILDLSTVTIVKDKIDFNNFTVKVLLQKPTIIIPNEFVELGAFIKLLARSIVTVSNQLKKDKEKKTSNHNLKSFNALNYDLAFTVKNFKFTLQDSKMNYSLTKLQHFIRNYLTKETTNRDSYEIMTRLSSLSEIPNSLLSLDIGSTSFILGKYDNQHLSIKDIISSIKSIDNTKFKLLPEHFSSIKGLALSFNLNDVSLTMRDYFTKILSLKRLDFGGFIINCLMSEDHFVNEFGSLKKTYYSLGLTLSQVECGYGLCYSPGTNEIIDWIKKCQAVMNKVKQDPSSSLILNANDSFGVPDSRTSLNRANFWDIRRYQNHGIFEINVPQKVKLIFATGLFPYSPESLLITFENFHLIYQHHLQLTCQRVMVKRSPRPPDEGHLINIPKFEVLVRLHWNCAGDPFHHYTNFIDEDKNVLYPFEDFKSRNFEILISLNVPYGKDVDLVEIKKGRELNEFGRRSRYMVKSSGSPFFYFQTDFIDWIISLPSLRYDMLRLYRINVNKYSDVESSEGNDEEGANVNKIYSDYMELIKHTLNAQLNAGDDEGNILAQISNIYLKVHIGATRFYLRVVYSNLKNPLRIELPNDSTKSDLQGNILEEKPEKIVLGLQGVIDTMTFSGCFYQKQNSFDPATLRKITKKKRSKYNMCRKVWKIKETEGRLNLLYLSTFDGRELVDLKPKEFANLRKNYKHISLNNPKVFREFFNLKDKLSSVDDLDNQGEANVAQSLLNNMNSPPNLHPAKLLRSSSVEDPLGTPMMAIKNIRTRHFNFEDYAINTKVNDSYLSNLAEMYSSPLHGIAEEEEETKNQTRLQDFEYSGLGTFFKADLLVYEQDKVASIEDDEIKASKHDIIENFFTFSGCKLLITSHLKDIINHFISSHKSTQKLIRVKSRISKEKSTSKEEEGINPVSTILTETQDEWILKNLHKNLFKSTKKESSRKIKFVINIEKPQFNLQYMSKDSQMLLASRKNCMITFYQFQLPFDTFGQDLKYLYKICFNKLECFVAPMNIDLQNKNAFWLEEDQLNAKYPRSKEEDTEEQYETREGLLLRIITCNKVFFNYTLFKLDKCDIDFSKEIDIDLNHPEEAEYDVLRRLKTAEFDAQRAEHMKKMIIQQNQADFWKDEPRVNGLSIKADELLSYSDSSGFRVFKNVMEFIVLLISSSKIKMKALVIQKEMLNELKHVGKRVFSQKIQEKILEREKIITKRKSNIEYSIRKGTLNLTKDETPFIKVNLNDMKGVHTIYDDESTDYILEVKSLEIENLLEPQSEYKMILSKLQSDTYQNENLMFYMRSHYYYVPGVLNASHKWKVYENFEFRLSPLVIKLTEDIYHKIYEFVFQEQFDSKKFKDKESLLFPKLNIMKKSNNDTTIMDKTAKEINESTNVENEEKKKKDSIQNEKESKHLPCFYRYARIGDLKVEFSFKSPSYIKRLNNVKVLMAAFTKYSKFWTTKRLFDSFEKHVIRQSVSQAFSIISQKLGISNKEIQLNEESADKELERKKKMLLGTK